MVDLARLDALTDVQNLVNLRGAAIEIVLMGTVATVMTDLWHLTLKAVVGLPTANWSLVGRWVAGFPRGVFVHRPITGAARVRGELAIGWMFHYAVGIAYAAIYLAIVQQGLGSEPTFLTAIVFALVLLAAPWFVMQPALGLGIMAARAPNAVAVRAVNVTTHAVFGLGLYLGALIWQAALI
jgi:hypothetical protein